MTGMQWAHARDDCAFPLGKSIEAVSCALAPGVLGLLYLIQLIGLLGIDEKFRDLTIYVVAGLIFAPLCAVILVIDDRISRRISPGFGLATCHLWLATLVLAALVLLTLFRSLLLPVDLKWGDGVKAIVATAATLHLVAILFILLHSSHRAGSRPSLELPFLLTRRDVQAACFASAFIVALVVLFKIPAESEAGAAGSFITSFPFDATDSLGLPSALGIALLVVMAGIALAVAEFRLRSRSSAWLATVRRLALAFALAFVTVCFLDYSLPADPLHYLTNVAPAIQLRHGGVLMVDTFSQYGPGPVLAMLIGFAFVPDTLSGAGLVVQIFNLAFFAAWLIWLYRSSPLRLPAMLLGICFIAILFAVWGVGRGNINFAPSILGLRYLPAVLMVLAISFLKPPATRSFWTASVAFIAALWSIEMFIGTLGIQLAFVGLLALRDRAWRRLLRDLFAVFLPVVLAVMLLTAYTVMLAGKAPNYLTYLGYISLYNFFSPFWAITANPLFFAWAAMLAPVFLTLTEAWRRALNPGAPALAVGDMALFYRFVPMAMLGLLMASYFAGRSVEYTVILSVLPFAGMVIPAALWWGSSVAHGPGRSWLAILLAPMTIFIFGLGFAIVALTRPDAPYSFMLHECRDEGRCTVGALKNILEERLHTRPVLERVGNRFSDSYFDKSGTVQDAVRLLEELDPERSRVTVLLGPVRVKAILEEYWDNVASDAALLYAGKWHRWPRSYTFADELLPERIAQILQAPIRLSEGELVLVRRNESLLGRIEAGILRKIRDETELCQLPESTGQVVAYRVSRDPLCAGG